MKSWFLLLLLSFTFVGHHFFAARWYAFTSLQGLLALCLLWTIRGKKYSTIWWVAMLGIGMEGQVFICQATGVGKGIKTEQFQGMCGAQAPWFPFFTLELMALAMCCSLWLDRNKNN